MMRRVYGTLACVAVLGCSMKNPAFDEARATEGTDEADTKDSSETGPGTSSTTDADTTTDSSDTTDDAEAGTSDTGPVESCDYLTRPALRLAITKPDASECLPTVDALFLYVGFPTLNQPMGVVTGDRCDDPQCSLCTNATYSVGAPGFEGLAKVWDALAMIAEPEGVDGLCIEVAATQLVGLIDGACVYESFGIVDSTIEHGPVFVGNVDNAPQTWIGGVALGQVAPPIVGEPLGSCSCAATHEDLAEVDCCEGSGVDPQFHALSFLGVDVEPGMSEPVMIARVPWRFHAVQAQAVPGCGNVQGDTELSWALARVD